MNLFLSKLKEILNNFGLIIVKKKIINFDQNFNYSKLNLLRVNILINYKIENLITTAGKKLGSIEDPYYFALKEAYLNKNKELFIQSFVKSIKSKVTTSRTAGEAVGLNNSKLLCSYPEWALVLPWEEITIDKNYDNYLTKFVSKRKKLLKFYKNCDKKKKKEIIYDDLAWQSHAEQFFDLIKSMSINGFKEANSVPVFLFKYKDTFRLSLCDDGNHRIRVAYILGLDSIPLKISKIIDYENINDWVNVKNRLYSLEEAKKIFLEYFNYRGNGAYV